MHNMQPSTLLPVNLRDQHPRAADMRDEILSGLRAEQKTLPCKYFYDARGSKLFDAICELPEYYLTRTELGIMETHVADMAAALGADVLLVEPEAAAVSRPGCCWIISRDPWPMCRWISHARIC